MTNSNGQVGHCLLYLHRQFQYFIQSGVVHSVKIPAGTKVIDFFEEKERYKLK